MSDELIAEALLGEEARKFIESDLGRCLIGFAEQEAEKALEDMLKVDPQNEKAIRDLQHKARWARSFKSWLMELVSEGENAIEAFKQQQHGS